MNLAASLAFKPRWFSLGASGTLIALLMAVLVFLQNKNIVKPDGYTIREIKLAALLPPPPPPPVMQTATESSATTIAITYSGSGAAIEFGEMNVNDDLSLEKITPPLLTLNNNRFLKDSLTLAWSEVFSLEDLDDRPRLLTKLDIRYPKVLSDRGVHTATAKVEVVIDSSGQVRLKQILYSSHAEMNPLITAMMKRTRFTSPKKDGVAVQASFNWPLEFNDK